MHERSDSPPRASQLTPPRLLAPACSTLKQAGASVIAALTADPRVTSAALLLSIDGEQGYARVAATGELADLAPERVSFAGAELLRAADEGLMLASQTAEAGGETRLFPVLIGEEARGALVVSGAVVRDAGGRGEVARFCREIALPLELLRLREEVARRARVAERAERLTESVGDASPDEAYSIILAHSTELVSAERGSLLVYDEAAGDLTIKAATGPRAEIVRRARVRLGDGVAGTVLERGVPLVVSDSGTGGEYTSAPDERAYKTASFISYPIILGSSRYGVLNVTDKRDGGAYDQLDLGLLRMIAPQLALALSHAGWRERATRFQLLSITDPLTDLLNRRYLEERLAEEAERSRRHGYPMSFMMIDIDDFKFYNDRNGHRAGDLALEITAQTLKSALRAADVASRYGGEEFSVLLPQTGAGEALHIAERIRRRVERTRYPHGDAQPRGSVTVSIGVATFAPGVNTAASVIEIADFALYAAKRSGKNRVESRG